jgi:sulfatase maturation enzyme AslB (radical SAM superfamily)
MSLAKKFYHLVHTNGFLADAVYSFSRPAKDVWLRTRNWVAVKQKISPEEVYEFRHLTGSNGLVIGITNICNGRCVFCAYPRAVDSKQLKFGVMSFPLFKKVVDEWAALGGKSIDVTNTVGDPLIDPGLLDKINYTIQEAGIKTVTFTTNGILLNHKETYKRLIDAGVSGIYISTEGTNKEIYEKVYGVKHYDDMLSGVHNLLEYNRSKGEPTHIAVRFRNSQKPSEIIRSQDFIRVIKPYFSDKVRCNFTVDFDNWGGSIQEQDMIGNMRLRHVRNEVNVPCRALFGFMVRHDGSVRLCGCRFKNTDMDDMVVGNMWSTSLLEISKAKKTWEIIEGFYSNKRPEACQKCSLYHPIDRKWLQARKETVATYERGHPAKIESSEATADKVSPAPESREIVAKVD